MARILLDYDSTITNFCGGMLSALNSKFGTDYQERDVTSWDWWRTALTKKQVAYVWGPEVYQSAFFTILLPEVEGAYKGVQALRELGHEFVVVSDRKPHMKEWIESWLHVLRWPQFEVVTSDRETYPKTQVAKDLGLTIAIEDSPHHAKALACSPHIEKVYVRERPYNQEVEGLPKVTRFKEWDEVVFAESLELVA